MWQPYNDIDIYEYYLGTELDLFTKYPSVFRDDGHLPALSFYEFRNKIYWNDFGNLDENPNIGKKDVVGFVVQKEGFKSRAEGSDFIIQFLVPAISDLKKISQKPTKTNQFSPDVSENQKVWGAKPEKRGETELKHNPTQITYNLIVPKKLKPQPKLSIRTNWMNYEWDYWKFIDRSLLKEYDIYPTHELAYYNELGLGRNLGSTRESPGFTYLYDQTIESWKCYKPFEKGADKWKSNNISKVIDGYKQLPDSGDTLIIVSSRKDLLTVRTYLGCWAICPTSETSFRNILEKEGELNERFKKIYVWLDADETGSMSTKKVVEKTNWNPIYPPLEFKGLGIKDQTDMVINRSPLFLTEFWQNNK